MRTLYSLQTPLGAFYVIANDPTEAQEILLTELNKADYGGYKNREVESIVIMAKELMKWSDSESLNFSSGNKLLIKNNEQ